MSGIIKRARNHKKMILSCISMMLIIAGVSLALFPFLDSLYRRYLNAAQVEKTWAEIQEAEAQTEEAALIPVESGEEEPGKEVLPDSLVPASGFIVIPKIDLQAAVGYGVEDEDLKKGPGFYPQSGYPDHGNVAIAAHRGVHGSYFRHLDKLEEGDEIRLYYREKLYIYEVEKSFITHNRDWSVIDPTPEAALTLTTCDLYTNTKRLIVRAGLEEIQNTAEPL